MDWGEAAARLGRGAAVAARRADSAARRIAVIVRGEVRIIDGVLVVSTRAIWVVWCAAMLGVQLMPRDIVAHGLTGEGVAGLVCLTWTGTTIMLIMRFWRWRQQKRWRQTAGRMSTAAATPAERPADPTRELITQLEKGGLAGAGPAIEAIADFQLKTRAQVRDNAARIDALTNALAAAFDAADHDLPVELAADIPTGPMLRLVAPLTDSEAG